MKMLERKLTEMGLPASLWGGLEASPEMTFLLGPEG